MKKITGVFVSILMAVLVFAGCSGQGSGAQGDEAPLKVAMDLKFPPFTEMDENGNPKGIEVDIAKAFGKREGTVKSMLFRMRQELKIFLEKEEMAP